MAFNSRIWYTISLGVTLSFRGIPPPTKCSCVEMDRLYPVASIPLISGGLSLGMAYNDISDPDILRFVSHAVLNLPVCWGGIGCWAGGRTRRTRDRHQGYGLCFPFSPGYGVFGARMFGQCPDPQCLYRVSPRFSGAAKTHSVPLPISHAAGPTYAISDSASRSTCPHPSLTPVGR